MNWMKECIERHNELKNNLVGELEHKVKQSVVNEIIEEIEKAFIYTPQLKDALDPFSQPAVSLSSSYSSQPFPVNSSITSLRSSKENLRTSMEKDILPPAKKSLITHKVRFQDENEDEEVFSDLIIFIFL